MKQSLTTIVSYFITGIGGYYIFTSDMNFFSMMIAALGSIGVLYDIQNNLKTKQYEC